MTLLTEFYGAPPKPRATPVVPPPPGSVGVGELLADSRTRRLWLGVAPATDISQALLIGDIVALQDKDAQIVTDMTALMNTGLDGKSDKGHHHVASDITDFDSAVKAVTGTTGLVLKGCIIMYSGSLANIGVGEYAGYVLCDGSNGTPDLRDKFVMGAGNVLPGTGGGSRYLSGVTGWGGEHNHNGLTWYHAISVAQMPNHDHGYSDWGHAHTASQPGHRHSYTDSGYGTTNGPGGIYADYAKNNPLTRNTDWVAPAITVNANYIGIDIWPTGGGEGHAHTIGGSGTHQHTISGVDSLPPYVALAFIMKL